MSSPFKYFETMTEISVLHLLLIMCLFVAFYLNIYNVPLFDLDEGAFSEATREMFERGDFISTYLNGEPRYDKPILIYWLQALSVSVFGVNEFAFRLPSALSASAWVLGLVWFARFWMDEKQALFAGIMLACSLSISVIGKAATADALLNCLLAFSMFFLFLHLHNGGRQRLWLFYLFASLGFLAKGPVALVVPGAVSFLYLLSKRRWRDWFLLAFNPVGIVIFLVVAMPWYVLQYQAKGWEFIQGFFLQHNVDRFQGAMEGHSGGLIYYVPVVLLALMPFTILVFKVFANFRLVLKNDLQLFLVIWFLFVLVFFSLSGTKLPHYVNYGLTGLVLLMTIYLHDVKKHFWLFLPIILFFVLMWLLPDQLAVQALNERDDYFRLALSDMDTQFDALYYGLIAVLLLLNVALLFLKKSSLRIRLAVTGLSLLVFLNSQLLVIMGNTIQAPVKQAALLAKSQQIQTVVMWQLNMPSFAVYFDHPLEKRIPRAGDVVFTHPVARQQLSTHEVLYEKGGVSLIRLSQVEDS